MSRTFDHYLDIVIPRALCQFTEPYELLDLAYIGSVCETSRTACVSKRDSDIVLFADIEDLIIILVERILLAGHAHPCKYKAASSADDISLSLVLLDLVDRLPCDTAVECYEIDSILSVQTDHIDKVLCGESREVALIVYDAVVYRYRTDDGRTLGSQFLSERLCVAVTRKVHDRFGSHLYGVHHLLHFHIIILAVPRNPEIYVYLSSQHAADTLRIEAFVSLVGAYRHLALGNQLLQLFSRHIFLLGNSPQFRCEYPFSCSVHLCCIIHRILLVFLWI